MTAGKPSRALSTLSPVPGNLRTPEAMRTAAETMRMSEIVRMEAKTRLAQEVTRALEKDRRFLRDVRKETAESWSTAGLEPKILEEKLRQRRAAGEDISAVYPAFKDYIPPIVYGKQARGNERDEKQRLIELQLDMSSGVGARVPIQRNEESDDDELNPYVKEEDEKGEDTPTSDSSALRGIKRDTSSTKGSPAAQRYSEIPPASSKRRGARTTTPRRISDTDSNENEEYESDSESSVSSSSSDSEDDGPNVPLIAVIRGQPIPKDLPTPVPSRAVMRRRKHRITRDPNNTLIAVFRGGEIVKKHDPADVEWVWVEKKGMVPKKRVRETGHQVGSCGQEDKHKSKKAKV